MSGIRPFWMTFDFMLRQNGGKISKERRRREFDALKYDEVQKIESIYSEIFSHR